MTLKKGTIYELQIQSLSPKGDGVGVINDIPITVGRTIPGDTVRIRLIKNSRRFRFGIVEDHLSENPNRQSAICPHFGTCGGCRILDVAYSHQLTLKTQVLRGCFDSQQLAWPETVYPIIGCHSSTFYRNKMEFSFGSRNDQIFLGLKKQGSFSEVVELQQCYLQSERIPQLLQCVGDFFSRSGLPVWNYHTHSGVLRLFGVRQSKADNAFMVNLVTSPIDQPIVTEFADHLMKTFPEVTGVLHTLNIGPGDGLEPANATLIKGHAHLTENLGRFTFKISPFSFFQTNSRQAEVLYQKIADVAQFSGSETLLDLYCGTGTIGIFLSQFVRNVIGIEENPSSIKDATCNAESNGITNISFHLGRVKNILKFNSFSPDVVVVDPPRSGIVPKALKRICELNAPTIIYVSCNPVTMAHNLAEFKQFGYQTTCLQPVDMFPNTLHIESIVRLEKI